jgi:septal ring factor EnvC (AmiA/AmiB activator)
MDDTKVMLRAIINGQSALKQELAADIEKLRLELKEEIKNVRQDIAAHQQETKKADTGLTKRLDKLGRQLAYLEDDAPTREEFDDLQLRVGKIECKHISI